MKDLDSINVKNYLAAMEDRQAKKMPETQDGQGDLDRIISEIEESYSEKAPFSKEEKERLKNFKSETIEGVDDFKPEIGMDELVSLIKEMVAKGEVDPMGVGLDKELQAERDKTMAKKNNPQDEIDMLEPMIDERELEREHKGLMGRAMMKMKERVEKLKSTKK
jgi:hypothetical protein